MPLSDAKIRKVKPGPKPYRMPDDGGLFLWVTPAGGRHWRMRYKRDGREGTLTFGSYPEIGLAAARERRDAARARIKSGLDPAGPEQEANNEPTLREVAEGWIERQRALWKPRHAADVLGSLVTEIFPSLGDHPIREITAPMILAVLRPVQERGAIEQAHRLRQRLSGTWTYAIAAGLADLNPAAGLTPALKPVVRTGRHPAATTIQAARKVLIDAEAIPAHPVTRLALRLLALTALRPGELRAGRWGEIEDLDGPVPVWRVPAERMKHRRVQLLDTPDHLVPLALQSVEILTALKPLSIRTGLLFPSWTGQGKPLSENALGFHLQRAGLGGVHVPHGWRAAFSSIMNERFPGDRAVIDLMLAHTLGNAVEAAYNRALHMERRRELAQLWADMLLGGLPPAATLLDLRRK